MKVGLIVLVLGVIGILAVARADDLDRSWPFVHPEDRFGSNAVLDLRGMNEKTAGESGFVRLGADGQFVRGDGTPIRFWACGSGEYQKDSKELASHARFLAKIGVNLVRLHTQIAPVGKNPELTEVNQKEIDGIWRAVAAFRREGIYVVISPYWANDKHVTRWGIDGYTGDADLWGLLFFNETLQRGYKAWVRALYEPSNPYTGIPLAKDPAVAIIQVQNEDGMFFWTMQGMKPHQKALLGSEFANWLKMKYGSLENASKGWDGFSARGDDLDRGIVDIMLIWEWTQDQTGGKAARLADQLEFFAQTQRKFYADIADYYHKELGCQQLINASNWITADGVRLNDVERYTDTADDVLAVNRYFTGVHEGKNNGWRIDPGDRYTNNPGVLNPRDLPTNLKQVVGHPILVTESSWVNPLDDQSEGPFLIAAYQSLTGVAGYCWFTATAAQFDNDPYYDFLNMGGQHPFRKWSCSTPALMGNFPAAAMMYRCGFLRQGDAVVVEHRSLADLWQRRMPAIAEDKGFDPNRMAGERGEKVNGGVVDPLAFLVGPVRVTYGGDEKPNEIADVSKWIDREHKIITSNTGQIRLDYGRGVCTIDAPAAQGVSGFLGQVGPVRLSTMDVDCHNDHASILAVSMDGLALGESKQILVQMGTRARPEGWIEQVATWTSADHKTVNQGFQIINTGHMPFRMASADARITIRNSIVKTATVLDTAGYPTGKIDLDSSGGQASFKAPADAMYVVLSP